MLEALLQRLFIFVIGGIFNDDYVIIFADYPEFLDLRLCHSLRLLLSLWGGGDGSETYFLRSSYKTKQALIQLLILLALRGYGHDY
jgi:hypothetical protein